MAIKIITLGSYVLPSRPLAELLNQTKKIYKEIGEGDGNNAQIMKALGNIATSESFYKNTADLQAFNLIEERKEGRSKLISLTPLALRAIAENISQKRIVLEQIFESFELWKKLRERFNDSSEPNDFSQALIDITGEKPPDEKTAESIKRSYHNDLKFLNDQLSGLSTIEQDNQSGMMNIPAAAKEPQNEVLESNALKIVVGSITYPESGVSIEIKDELSFEIAQMLLEAMRKRLGITKKQIQTSLPITGMQ